MSEADPRRGRGFTLPAGRVTLRIVGRHVTCVEATVPTRVPKRNQTPGPEGAPESGLIPMQQHWSVSGLILAYLSQHVVLDSELVDQIELRLQPVNAVFRFADDLLHDLAAG